MEETNDLKHEDTPARRTYSLHSDIIEVAEGETLGQVMSRTYPKLVAATPRAGKKFMLTLVLTGEEVDA